MTVHVFNPEVDYARASSDGVYTPPRQIVALRADMALLPALYAAEGDAILLLDPLRTRRWLPEAQAKGLRIVDPREAAEFFASERPDRLEPWGWSLSLRRCLAALGVPEEMMPSEQTVRGIHDISHRRTTILFLREFRGFPAEMLPREIFSFSELQNAGKTILKAPYSSSGRGVFLPAEHTPRLTEEWVRGICRRQGSVIAEPLWERAADFASEWVIEDGEPRFQGLSLFRVDHRLRYAGNVHTSQINIRRSLEKYGLETLLEEQKNVLKRTIAPRYSGPLGIDMLASPSGLVNPCVEINFRRTMGSIWV